MVELNLEPVVCECVVCVFSHCLGVHLKRVMNRNAVFSASKQKQILRNFFEITSHVSMKLFVA